MNSIHGCEWRAFKSTNKEKIITKQTNKYLHAHICALCDFSYVFKPMIRFIFLHYYVNVISTGEGDRDPPNDPISSHSHPITNTSSKSKPKANILCFDDRSTDLAVTLDRRRLEYQSFLPLPVSVLLSVCSSNK